MNDMTKYILNSGGLRNNPELAKKFFAEIVKGLGDKPHILFCFFAEKRENWEEKFTEYVKGFRDLLPEGVGPEFELALPDKFTEQVRQADAIYIHGGDDHLVQYWLRQFDIPKIWEDKVVATNSASSNALSKHFWTCDWRKCMDGLGILPIKFLPHYQSAYGAGDPRGPIDWEKAYNKLKEWGDKSLPIHALKEGEFVVIER